LLQTVSIAILIGFGILVFFAFSYSFILSSQQNRTVKRIDEARRNIDFLKTIEAKHLLVRHKLNSIKEIRENYGIDHTLLTKLYGFLVDKVVVNNIVYLENEGAIKTGIIADDVVSFSRFMSGVSEYAEDEDYSKVYIGEINRDESNKYFGEITLVFIE
jgi:hypothetical protein